MNNTMNNNTDNNMNNNNMKIGKCITRLLRHHLNTFATAREDGFVDIDELIAKLLTVHSMNVTKEQLVQMANECDKQRIKICLDTNKIRANQGHSSSNSIQLNETKIFTPITKPITGCLHVTHKKNIPLIKQKGLNKMNRQHIHFAQIENKHLLRNRHVSSVDIELDMESAMKDGCVFYLSENNVVLSSGINGVISAKHLLFHL